MLKWFVLWRMHAANIRMDKALDALPPGWNNTPEEFAEEIIEMIRARNNFHYWMKRAWPTNK